MVHHLGVTSHLGVCKISLTYLPPQSCIHNFIRQCKIFTVFTKLVYFRWNKDLILFSSNSSDIVWQWHIFCIRRRHTHTNTHKHTHTHTHTHHETWRGIANANISGANIVTSLPHSDNQLVSKCDAPKNVTIGVTDQTTNVWQTIGVTDNADNGVTDINESCCMRDRPPATRYGKSKKKIEAASRYAFAVLKFYKVFLDDDDAADMTLKILLLNMEKI